ncbi:hypothetical protein BO79DRAFT_43811 [Aspergillus costaricaensis CBS 115574]|uniref:Uncharacterized protein n=1 Tax=Aspergillus costaricaensis CBS 115574 TaxID=1448317 RepID=A0ACD1IS21_9EURO|nr:hypothetical protein BO79DRAFT_43811 [Aspergillus costaricaensis CBS 115574]RAK93200.1 hypothetical protein BO79DRAFT_43811 [Aspergillus costaricaensis CBS 115574]
MKHDTLCMYCVFLFSLCFVVLDHLSVLKLDLGRLSEHYIFIYINKVQSGVDFSFSTSNFPSVLIYLPSIKQA